MRPAPSIHIYIYIYIYNWAGTVSIHAFSPSFPAPLRVLGFRVLGFRVLGSSCVEITRESLLAALQVGA